MLIAIFFVGSTSFYLSSAATGNLVSIFIGLSVLFAIGYLINFVIKSPEFGNILSSRNYLFLLTFFIVSGVIWDFSKKTDNSEAIKWDSKNAVLLRDNIWYKLDSLGFPFSVDQKRIISDCIVEKIKLFYPKGIPRITKSSPKEIDKIFQNCMSIIFVSAKMEGWTPQFEEFLITRFVEDKSLIKYYPDFNNRFKIAVCLTKEIKNQHPDGLDWGNLSTKINIILNGCK